MKQVKKPGSGPLHYRDEKGLSRTLEGGKEAELPDSVYERYKHKLELMDGPAVELKREAQTTRKLIKAKKVDTGKPGRKREKVAAEA